MESSKKVKYNNMYIKSSVDINNIRYNDLSEDNSIKEIYNYVFEEKPFNEPNYAESIDNIESESESESDDHSESSFDDNIESSFDFNNQIKLEISKSEIESNEKWNIYRKTLDNEIKIKCNRNIQNNNVLKNQYNQMIWYINNFNLKEFTNKYDYLQPLIYRRTNNPNIYIAQNVLPLELANDFRKFVNSSPLIKHTEDTLLLKNIYNEGVLNNELMLKNTYNLAVNNPNYEGMWKWELYSPDLYRLSPTNMLTFITSPIYKLIQAIISVWTNTNTFLNYDIKKLELDTCVIQKMIHGSEFQMHKDGYDLKRKIAFIYYLNKDNWTRDDGGCISVVNQKKSEMRKKIQWDSFLPEFNSMIIMTNTEENDTPLHKVDVVNSSEPRYALVGFLSDP